MLIKLSYIFSHGKQNAPFLYPPTCVPPREHAAEGQRSQSKVRSTFAHSFLAHALVFTYFFYVFTNFFPWSFCCVSASAQFTCDSRSCASAPVARRRSKPQHLKCSCGIAPTPSQLQHQQRSPNRRFTDTSGTRRAFTRIQLACFSPRVQAIGLSITWRCRLSFGTHFRTKHVSLLLLRHAYASL